MNDNCEPVFFHRISLEIGINYTEFYFIHDIRDGVYHTKLNNAWEYRYLKKAPSKGNAIYNKTRFGGAVKGILLLALTRLKTPSVSVKKDL